MPCAKLGERARSLEWAARALSWDPEEALGSYNVSCAYSLLGETDKAIDCLEKAVDQGWGHKSWMERFRLCSVRSNPRFQPCSIASPPGPKQWALARGFWRTLP